MKKMARKFVVCGFWIPVAISLWLNPGRNGENIYKFSEISLLLLACCGLVLTLFALIGFIQPKLTKFLFSDEDQRWLDRVMLLLALIIGIIDIYYAGVGLT